MQVKVNMFTDILPLYETNVTTDNISLHYAEVLQ